MHKITMGINSHILQEIKSIMYGHVKSTAKNINEHSKKHHASAITNSIQSIKITKIVIKI